MKEGDDTYITNYYNSCTIRHKKRKYKKVFAQMIFCLNT